MINDPKSPCTSPDLNFQFTEEQASILLTALTQVREEVWEAYGAFEIVFKYLIELGQSKLLRLLAILPS